MMCPVVVANEMSGLRQGPENEAFAKEDGECIYIRPKDRKFNGASWSIQGRSRSQSAFVPKDGARTARIAHHLPQRRAAGRADGGWRDRLAEVDEDVAYHCRLGDEGDDPHVGAAERLAEWEDLIDAGEQQHPRADSFGTRRCDWTNDCSRGY